MKTFRHVLLESSTALVLFLVAFAIVILFEICFKEAPEWFSGGAELASLAVNISLSYIAGFIFYCSTEIRKRVSNIKSTKLLAKRHCSRVHSLIKKIFQSVNETYEIPVKDEIRERLQRYRIEDIYQKELFTFNNNHPSKIKYKQLYHSVFLPKLAGLERDVSSVSHLIESNVVVALDDLFNSQFKSMFSNGMMLSVDHKDMSLSHYEKAFLDLADKAAELQEIFESVYGDKI